MELSPSDAIELDEDQWSPLVSWGPMGVVIGATGTAIGTGKQNTQKILNHLGEIGDYAAQLINWSDGWFLPSYYELLEILNVLDDLDLDPMLILPGMWYWSSSEGSANTAWVLRVRSSPYGGTINKVGDSSYLPSVRAIRSF